MKTTTLCALAAALMLPLAAMAQPMGGRGWDGWRGGPGPMGPPERPARAQAPQTREVSPQNCPCPICRARQAFGQGRQHGPDAQAQFMGRRHGGLRGPWMMARQHRGQGHVCGFCGRGPGGRGPMGMWMSRTPAPQDQPPGQRLRQMGQQRLHQARPGMMGGAAHGMMQPSLAPETPARPQRPQAQQAAPRDPGLARIQTELSALAKELREIRQDVTALRREVAQMKQASAAKTAPARPDMPGGRGMMGPGAPGRGMMGQGMPGRGMMGTGRPTPTHPDPESDPD